MTTTTEVPRTALRSRIGRNPVLRRELLERWRGKRAILVVSAYVSLLALLTLLLAWIGTNILEQQAQWNGGGVGSGPMLGRFLVENLLALTLGLALLLAPAYAATQISGERERKTLALLRITLVRPGQIVLGKLGASVAWLLVLVMASVPLMALGFFLGGITLPQLGRGLVTLVALTISIAAIGIGISSMTKRSTPALVMTILTVGAITLGTLFAGVVEAVARQDINNGNERPVSTLLNPFVALADAVGADNNTFFFGNELPSVLSGFGQLLPRPQENFGFEPEFAGGLAFDGPGFGFGEDVFIDRPGLVDVDAVDRANTPYWLLTSGFYVMIGALFLFVAARRVARVDIE